MNGQHVITRLPFFGTCLRGVLNVNVAVPYGIGVVERTPVAFNYRQFPPKCAWEQFGTCCQLSNRAGG
jgi:hypothetical protein